MKSIIVKIELDNNLTVVSTVEPVKSDTPRDQGNVADCTGCRKTQVSFWLTEIFTYLTWGRNYVKV